VIWVQAPEASGAFLPASQKNSQQYRPAPSLQGAWIGDLGIVPRETGVDIGPWTRHAALNPVSDGTPVVINTKSQNETKRIPAKKTSRNSLCGIKSRALKAPAIHLPGSES